MQASAGSAGSASVAAGQEHDGTGDFVTALLPPPARKNTAITRTMARHAAGNPVKPVVVFPGRITLRNAGKVAGRRCRFLLTLKSGTLPFFSQSWVSIKIPRTYRNVLPGTAMQEIPARQGTGL